MSMIQAQVDELRSIAEQLDGRYGFGGIVRAIREAADTIWELRCKCADLVDERERLRSCLSDDADNARQIMGENARLMELARFIMHQCNDDNPRCDECIGWNDGECVALLRMRELRVEGDG